MAKAVISCNTAWKDNDANRSFDKANLRSIFSPVTRMGLPSWSQYVCVFLGLLETEGDMSAAEGKNVLGWNQGIQVGTKTIRLLNNEIRRCCCNFSTYDTSIVHSVFLSSQLIASPPPGGTSKQFVFILPSTGLVGTHACTYMYLFPYICCYLVRFCNKTAGYHRQIFRPPSLLKMPLKGMKAFFFKNTLYQIY